MKMKRKFRQLTIEITFPHMFRIPDGEGEWSDKARKFVHDEVDSSYFDAMIEEGNFTTQVVDNGIEEVEVDEEQEFEEWRKQRKLCHDLGRNGNIEDFNGVPGYLYGTYFIHMQECGNFGVLLASVERSYTTLAEAERSLWDGWVRAEHPYSWPVRRE